MPPGHNPWYFSTINDGPFLAAFYTFVAVAGLGFLAYLALWYLGGDSDGKAQGNPAAKGVKSLTTSLIFLLWLFFEFSFMCARFDHFRHTQYEPWVLGHSGRLVLVGPDFPAHAASNFSGSVPALGPGAPNCYFSLGNATQAAGDTCRFGLAPISGHLMSETYVQFSVGLGLIIYFLLQLVVLGVHVSVSLTDMGTITKFFVSILEYGVSVLLGAQQAMVLLPLTVAHANGICASLQVRPGHWYGGQ
jgi:hypothetical protein